MSDPEHLRIISLGVKAWNAWRKKNPHIRPNLRKANLKGKNLENANFNDSNMRRANLSEANLSHAHFRRADLRRTNCSNAILNGADLTSAILIETNLEKATLNDCLVYGISAWNTKTKGSEQKDLIISKMAQPAITVDNLDVAQFIYLLINNQNIRDVIDTITSKVVLILGSFSKDRKAILDGLRNELRRRNYLPVVFDFSVPRSRDVAETVKVLAGLAKFVLADVTDAKEVRAELHEIVPEFPSLPVRPLLREGDTEFISLSKHLRKYPWMLEVFQYVSLQDMTSRLDELLALPEKKAVELRMHQQ